MEGPSQEPLAVQNRPTVHCKHVSRESWRSVVPSTYMADALRQVMVGATPQVSLGIDVTALVAFLAILSVAAVRLFQWE